MRYRVLLRDEAGGAFTLVGTKHVESGRLGQLWRETTTLHTRVLEGHAEALESEDHRLLAAGDLRMGPSDVARQLLTAEVDGPRLFAQARGVARFGGAFVGNLWDVYARRVSNYGPF